jgi:serine protease
VDYPASIPAVNAVGAVDSRGIRASFSNFGSALDFVAPGKQIRTTDRSSLSGFVSGDYILRDGTSYATPYAAGVAALILSRNPNLPPQNVEQILRSTAIDK